MKQKRSGLKMLHQLKVTLRLRIILPVLSVLVIFYLLFYFNFATPNAAIAGTETMGSGSYIINMGVTPQTYNNGLKPYGMIYDLMVNYKVPVKWVIEPTKAKDGTDFTYSGLNYKGGCFIIPVEYINSTVNTRITYWVGQGISGLYTTSAISVPVYATLTNFPRIIIDTISNKESIITNYFDNALIPSTAYQVGSPSFLTYCHDMWINPHGDPTWATHGYLYDLVTVAKSYAWLQCHAVSVTEGVENVSSPYQKLTFLSTTGLKCYSSGKCGAGITETHAGNSTSPYTHYYPTDPVMQFMGTMDGACDGGSEKWYQPQSTGAWRSTTKRLVTTATGTSPNEGVLMAYGPAFGDTSNGYVMYEAGHNIDGNGTTAEKVAAQRAFFNFVLLAGYKKQLQITGVTMPSSAFSNESKSVSVTVSGGSPGYNYSWTSSIGGTFSSPTSASTTFTAPTVGSTTSGTITCTVSDACSRANFISRPFTVYSTLPISLKSFTGKYRDNRVELTWVTATEVNNDYFTLERSFDGINYTEIGKVSGSRNSKTDIYYGFNDNYPGEKKNYYRLKQTDFDGITKTFDAIYVKVTGLKNNKTSLIPNPFTDQIRIDYFSESQSTVILTIMDKSGNVVRTETLIASEGLNKFQFNNLDDLKPGLYFAIIGREDEKEIIKLIKL